MEKTKATLYLIGGMGGSVARREGYLVDNKLVDYAQYKQIPQIDFIFKGKRTTQRFVKGYNPFFLILKGWDTPNYSDDEGFNITKKEDVTISKSKYLSFDERYILDFNTFINPLLDKNIILADYRENKGVCLK